jgi:NAD(P)H-nitrite reductase large subunit
MNFTDKDYFANIAKYLEGYCELKKLSEINKSSNIFVKEATNFKNIVKEKRNKYNCDMLKYYLNKKICYELNNNNYNKTINKLKKSTKNYKTLTDKECLYLTFSINSKLYTKLMNKRCLPYLEDIISYYFNEKNKNNWSNNDIHKISIQISKILFNIILSIDNNYKLKNENILLWISTNRIFS